MEQTIVFGMSKADLVEAMNEIISKEIESKILNKFYHILVSVNTLAEIYNQSTSTIRNYIDYALLIPIPKSSGARKYEFRLSYILTTDFDTLKKMKRDYNKKDIKQKLKDSIK
jgi:hypothetical protein